MPDQAFQSLTTYFHVEIFKSAPVRPGSITSTGVKIPAVLGPKMATEAI